jgi:hypothetical protein
MNIEALRNFDVEGLLNARALVEAALNNPKKKVPIDEQTLNEWRQSIVAIENEIMTRPREMLELLIEMG